MSQVRRSAAPWGLIGAALAIAAVEAGVARLDLQLTRPESIDWRTTRHAASTRAPGRDVLAFGTSMIQMSVFPSVIERQTGRKAYNLAVGGGRTSIAYYYLKRAIRSGARPSAVLIDVHPWNITASYKGVSTGWPDALGLEDALDMAWTTRDPDLFATVALARGFTTVYNRLRIRQVVLDALADRHWSFWGPNLICIRNRNRNQGAFIGRHDPAYRGEVSASLRSILLSPPRPVDPHEWRYLERFTELAEAHGARVYWVIPPFAPALQAERQARGLDADYDRWIERLLTRYPNVAVLDARRSGFEASAFLDASHVDMQGGAAFSLAVAEALGPSPGAPRKVDLRIDRRPLVDVPLEDLHQSQLAITTNPKGARR